MRYELPWTFSTFDYRTLCGLLAAQGRFEFETAKVNGRTGNTVHTDRGDLRAPLIVDALGWRRVLGAGANIQPPDALLSRGPGGPSLRLRRSDLEVWIDRSYVPAGYGWSFPADGEVRIGVGSFDPRYHVKRADRAPGAGPQGRHGALPGQLDPPRAARRHRGWRLLRRRLGRALPAAHRRGHPHGAVLRPGLRPRAGRRHRGTPDAAPRPWPATTPSRPRTRAPFAWMLRVQRLVPRVAPRLLAGGLRAHGQPALSAPGRSTTTSRSPTRASSGVRAPVRASAGAGAQAA